MAILSVKQRGKRITMVLTMEDGKKQRSVHEFDSESEAESGMIRAAEMALGMARATIAGKSDVVRSK